MSPASHLSLVVAGAAAASPAHGVTAPSLYASSARTRARATGRRRYEEGSTSPQARADAPTRQCTCPRSAADLATYYEQGCAYHEELLGRRGAIARAIDQVQNAPRHGRLLDDEEALAELRARRPDPAEALHEAVARIATARTEPEADTWRHVRDALREELGR